MNLFRSASDAVIGLLRQGSIQNRKQALDEIRAEMASWKPGGYDQAVSKCRDYYEDRQGPHLKKVLAVRFPVGAAQPAPETAAST